MKREEHRAKAERLERSLERCRESDYESIIEGAMLAASHWINFALHGLAASPPEKDFMHPYFVTAEDRRAFDGALGKDVLEAHEEIEDLRPFFVRGADPGGERAGARARELLALIRAKALAVPTPR